MESIRGSTISHRPSDSSFVVNRSFISTTFTTEVGEDLRKSKILNLPNYKKVSLSENLPFVVVFQTIQIERLSAEIESNRVRLKDFQRQIFNAQNYEVQIRELTEKCFAYELEREKYSQENEKMNLICHQLYTELEDVKRKYAEVDFTLKDKYELEKARAAELLQEIERWRARYMAAEKSKAKELDDLRLMMESQRKSMLDREMRELTLKFQAERGTLENEIRKLREALEYKQRDLDETKNRLQRSEMVVVEMRGNLTQLAEYENKIAMLAQEMTRLNDVLRSKQDELEQARTREQSLTVKLKEQSQWQFDNRQLRSTLESRTREIEEWRIRCSKLEDGLSRAKELSIDNANLTNKLSFATNEIERMNGALRGKLEQVEQWKQRVASQQGELTRYKNQTRDLQNYQRKVQTLQAQLDRLSTQLKTRLQQIDDWRNKCSKLQVSINSYVVYERENKDLQDRMTMQTRTIEENKHRITRLESDIGNLRQQERKLDDAEKRNAMLGGELERLNGLMRSKQQEIEDSKVRHTRLEQSLNEYRVIEGKVRDYQSKIAMLTQEIQRLNNVLRNKTEELERANSNSRRLQDECLRLRQHESKLVENERVIMSLNTTIDSFKKESSRWEDRNRGMEGKLRDLESNCFGLTQEKDKLANVLRTRTTEYEDLRVRVGKLEQENFRARELEANYNESQNRMNMITAEIERLERLYREAEAEVDRERALSTQLAFKVIILSAEVQRATSGSGVKSKDFLQLQERFYQCQSISREKDSQILMITQKLTNLQSKISYLGGELQRYLSIVTQNEQHARKLQQQITQYQDYAKRIKILSGEIDRLTGENRGLQEDIKRLRLRYADQISGETRHQSICLMVVIMAAEIESLRSRVSEKEIQFQEMRKSILEPVRNFK